jgi:phospholipid/cholesterol/gamma-HCH transport system permease protein
MANEPSFLVIPQVEGQPKAVRLALNGHWSVQNSALIERLVVEMFTASAGMRKVILDLAQVTRLDTAGAWLIDRARVDMSEAGLEVAILCGQANHEILLQAAHYRSFDVASPQHFNPLISVLVDVGANVVSAGRDVLAGVAFLGEVTVSFLRTLVRPDQLRLTSIVFHLESFGFHSLPIIALINFLVGGIVAQQGIFQLSRFGASTFTVDLIGILVLRELAVLLTSIMIAGRSGSAITAELGSMKMREEIDAMRVMGLDPVDVLVLPRIIALLIALPMLTFVADLSALLGGLLVSWSYGNVNPDVFLARLQDAIAINTFMVGLIKAPVIALVIGMVAAIEGFQVQGSAESLGRQVTASVVKSIFMVIVIDGLFAMFFAAIDY